MSPEQVEAIQQLLDAALIAEAALTETSKTREASRISRAAHVVRIMFKL